MTLIYGHRGAKGEAPENTLTSFQQCLKHGVRRCELDLHLSMDGELMVIHDPTLKRTTDRRGKVVEHTAAELVTYDARKGGPGWIKPCPIPTLEELFEAITLKRLGIYFNPILLLNTRGFYAPLQGFMASVIEERFMNPEHAAMWSLVDAVADVLPAIRATPRWREDAREYAVVR